jgi:hypothetical protein
MNEYVCMYAVVKMQFDIHTYMENLLTNQNRINITKNKIMLTKNQNDPMDCIVLKMNNNRLDMFHSYH